ncbi:MAG: hypothetical protein ABSG15_15010 [FCB group bacterium]
MNIKFTRLFQISIVLALIIFATNIYAQPVKRVLLEQHTGAWCGWCPDGRYIQDQILAMYPNQVIAVELHNGDKMVIPEEGTIAASLGLTVFPSGTVDRKSFGGSYFQDRSVWQGDCEGQMLVSPKADVHLYYSINPQTSEFSGTITSTMLETVNDDLKFNVIVYEDSVSGTGTGWDQVNYLSGQAGYQNNPYYSQPYIMTGFKHMKVARIYLGGAWGTQGNFTNPALEGKTYVNTFTYTLNSAWNLNRLHFVGLVQAYTNSKEVLNCINGVVGTPIYPTFELSSQQSQTKAAVSSGNAFTKTFSIKNVSNAPVTYEVSVVKSQRTPSDWTADVSLSPEVSGKKDGIASTTAEVIVSPQQSSSLIFKLTPGQTKGIGDATMTISVKNDASAIQVLRTISAISAEIDKFEVLNAGETQYSVMPMLKTLGYNDYFNISSDDYTAFSPGLTKTKVLIWNCGVNEIPSASDVSSITAAAGQNVGILLMGNQLAYGLSSTNNALSNFGIQDIGYSTQGYGAAPYRVWLSGIPGDPISKDVGNSSEGNLINWLIDIFKIINPTTTTSVMHLANDGNVVSMVGSSYDTTSTKAADEIFAVKCIEPKSLVFLCGITPFEFVNAPIRQKLLDNAIKWVTGVTDVQDNTYTLNDGEFSMNVSPNPVISTANVSFHLSGNQNANINFVLYDNLGNQIQAINNGVTSPGEYILPLNTSGLNSGYYRLVTNLNNKIYSTPVIIVK